MIAATFGFVHTLLTFKFAYYVCVTVPKSPGKEGGMRVLYTKVYYILTYDEDLLRLCFETR